MKPQLNEYEEAVGWLWIIVLALCLLLAASTAEAAIPQRAKETIPVLVEEMRLWPGGDAAAVAAQVHKETCVTPTHRFCWSPRAELKTSREYGFGLGQHTIAYRADGSERFNVWADLRARHAELLAGWSWVNRYDARMQLRAIILYDSHLADGCRKVSDDVLECAFSSYNGGFGGYMQDAKLCAATPGCDSRRWWGNVERTSLKAKTAISGYGNSFFDINRKYVRFIMREGRAMYEQAVVVA